jgi:hypothetical protein
MEKLRPLLIVLVLMPGIIGISVLGLRWARKSSRRAKPLFIGDVVVAKRPLGRPLRGEAHRQIICCHIHVDTRSISAALIARAREHGSPRAPALTARTMAKN